MYIDKKIPPVAKKKKAVHVVIFDWHSGYKGVYVVPDPQTSMALYGLTCHTSSVWSVKALRLLSSTLPSLPCRLF